MREYRWVKDVADPQIDQDQWLEEFPIDASRFSAVVDEFASAVEARALYFHAAGAPAGVVQRLEAVASHITAAHNEALAAMTLTCQYVNELRLPSFPRAS